MVEVFKTNVHNKWLAEKLMEILYQHFPNCKINFDLYDRDKILRVEGNHFPPKKVKMLINEKGFKCDILD